MTTAASLKKATRRTCQADFACRFPFPRRPLPTSVHITLPKVRAPGTEGDGEEEKEDEEEEKKEGKGCGDGNERKTPKEHSCYNWALETP